MATCHATVPICSSQAPTSLRKPPPPPGGPPVRGPAERANSTFQPWRPLSRAFTASSASRRSSNSTAERGESLDLAFHAAVHTLESAAHMLVPGASCGHSGGVETCYVGNGDG